MASFHMASSQEGLVKSTQDRAAQSTFILGKLINMGRDDGRWRSGEGDKMYMVKTVRVCIWIDDDDDDCCCCCY